MASDDQSGTRPAGPVVLRIKLRYDDLDAMVQKFASNVGKSGLFLPTKSIQPVGTEVKFELRLANDTPVLVGLGRVKHVRPPDPENPRSAFGMGIELMRVSREGREVIIRMLERRRAMGLPDVLIPAPDDAEAARRNEVETQPRGETSAVVRDAMAQIASAPVGEQVLSGSEPTSGPIGVAKERPSAPLLTSPRAGVVMRDENSSRAVVPMLSPEKSRPRRPRVQELIERASELSAPIIAAMPAPELDMQVDLDSVLTRARTLAGGDLEVELEALREAAAAPIEISVEAASAELARQLGGKAISKREKSARWAPPPVVHQVPSDTTPPPASDTTPPPTSDTTPPDFSTKTRAETAADPSATIAAIVEAAVVASAPEVEASPQIVPEESYVIRPSTPTYDTAYEDARDEDPVAEFGNDDRTRASGADDAIDPASMSPKPFGPATEIKTEPTGHQALMIDDDADISSFERALDAARIHTGISQVAAQPAPDDSELDDEPDLLASGEYQIAPDDSGVSDVSESTQTSNTPQISDQLAAQLEQQLAEAEEEAERELADGLGEEREEEVSELDVLAEADEDDEDLLGAHGEAEVSSVHLAAAPQPVDDFASRLDLDDDAPSEEFDRQAAREFDAHVPPHEYGEPAAHDYVADALADFDEEPVPQRVPRYRRASSEQSSNYTIAEDLPHASLQLPDDGADEFDEPHSYAPAPVAARAPEPARAPKPTPGPQIGPDPRLLRHGRATTGGSEDLEDALAALDVDFDDLSADRQQRSYRGTPSAGTKSPRPLPGLPMERPPTGQHPVIKQPTSQQPVIKQPTSQQPVAKSPTRPPPIPAAARKAPTQQVAVVRTPAKRAATDDDGVVIDFDDDE
jgi:hypothetical protein